ncbi:MAG: calcium-binding protein, partial [Pseudohongiella sp.]|nr:calcium-binding protein [Pseudohongiella sp.]
LYGEDGDDQLYGGEQQDLLDGGPGNDTLIGGAGWVDTLIGGDGIDTTDYSATTLGVKVDLVAGKALGSERFAWDDPENTDSDILIDIENIIGGSGNDVLIGNEYSNSITGGAGNDELYGEAGNDTLDGGNQNDLLDGGAGDDALYGGQGNDTFVFYSGSGADTVHDFTHGDDRLDLSAFSFSGFNAVQSSLNSDNYVVIQLDQNDSITLIGVGSVTASDFVF